VRDCSPYPAVCGTSCTPAVYDRRTLPARDFSNVFASSASYDDVDDDSKTTKSHDLLPAGDPEKEEGVRKDYWIRTKNEKGPCPSQKYTNGVHP